MLKYKSDFPNQVHQLNVSISQNYYLLKDETIKWQEKKFEVNWKNFTKSNKRHLVTYIIRDHYSSCFFAELHPIDKLPQIEEFLFNAWRSKDDYEFRGIGHSNIIPQTTLGQFPKLTNFFKRAKNIHLQLPTNGFSSAVRSIREWEHQLKFITSIVQDTDKLPGFQQHTNYINRFINNQYDREDSNLKKWAFNQTKIILPKDKESFFKFFEPLEDNSITS